ncbi:MAG: hypothetical protein V4681_02550 [Patescibacteria group bacterium]
MDSILAIEDSSFQLNKYREVLGEEFDVIFADCSRAARHYFKTNRQSIVAIIFDGNLSSTDPEPTTEKIVADFRTAGFTGPMFAATTDDRMEKLLLRNGCSHKLSKHNSPTWLKKIKAALR